MKYSPQKVFIIKDSRYIGISYEEFCHHTEENNNIYKDKFFLPLHGMLMEVTEDIYKEFYKNKRRQKYLDERSEENGDFSYDMLTTNQFNGEDILIDESQDIAEMVADRIMLDKLQEAVHLLTDDERELIQALYYEELTEREYARKKGIYHNAVHKRKVRILAKLKKILEI